jgi:hypothetical protein
MSREPPYEPGPEESNDYSNSTKECLQESVVLHGSSLIGLGVYERLTG